MLALQDVLKWLAENKDKTELIQVCAKAEECLCALRHTDPHGAGIGTREAGYKPVSVSGQSGA